MWPSKHEKLVPVADSRPVEDECTRSICEAVIESGGSRVHLVMLVEERLVVRLGKHSESKDASELAPGLDCTRV